MSDSPFDQPYDPVATPSPAFDDDLEPRPAPAPAWNQRTLAQTLLARARARQEAIADAFVDAILDGKISLFRLLIDLEQAAIAAETQARQAHEPTLAAILLPMLQRERNQAAAAHPNPHAQNNAPAQPSDSTPARPMLVAHPDHPPQAAATPLPGITDLDAAAQRPCRSRARKLPPRRPSQRSIPSIHACLPVETRHASRRYRPAPNDSYTHTIQIVLRSPPRHRRRRLPRCVNASKHENSIPYLPQVSLFQQLAGG